MPKTLKARKQRRGGGKPVRGTGSASPLRAEQVTQRTAPGSFLSPAVRGAESLIFPAMVALGCWGMVVYFLFLSVEANHILFGGMAVLMALLWTFSLSIRVRKLLQQRSRT